jgi:hypothetical protein
MFLHPTELHCLSPAVSDTHKSMKTAASYLIGIIFIITLHSCDKIDPPYQVQSSKGIVYINHTDSLTFNGDTLAFGPDNSTPFKKVLAEDYTGHLCGNCPYAGVYLNDTLRNLYYPDNLLVISVHAGFFAGPCPGNGTSPCPGTSAPPGAFAKDYTNPAGNDWDNFFGVSALGNPNGMIDRIGYPGNQVKAVDTWRANVQSEANLTPESTVRILTSYNVATRELGVAVQTKFLSSKTGTYKLEVVITEDSIVDWQEWYAPNPIQYDSAYIHRHVLRGAINGSFAGAIAEGTIAGGTIFLSGFSTTLQSAWNAAHCKAVAFLYDDANYRVLQVEEAKVIQ